MHTQNQGVERTGVVVTVGEEEEEEEEDFSTNLVSVAEEDNAPSRSTSGDVCSGFRIVAVWFDIRRRIIEILCI